MLTQHIIVFPPCLCFHFLCVSFIDKVITRREQLLMRAKKDKKGKGKEKGKGKDGKGKNGKGKDGKGKAEREKERGKERNIQMREGAMRRRKVKVDRNRNEDLGITKMMRMMRSQQLNLGKQGSRSMPSIPNPSPASPAELPSRSVEMKPEPKRRARKVATPQAQEIPPPEIPPLEIPPVPARMDVDLTPEQMVDTFKAELSRQWKSGKTDLRAGDFRQSIYTRSTLSCYFSRSRPAIGVKARGSAKKGVNKEYAYFSFNLKEVCNVGLAMRCATICVP